MNGHVDQILKMVDHVDNEDIRYAVQMAFRCYHNKKVSDVSFIIHYLYHRLTNGVMYVPEYNDLDLWDAVVSGDIDVVRQQLMLDVDTIPIAIHLVLYSAVDAGRIEMVKLLLEYDDYNNGSLMSVIEPGTHDAVRVAVRQNASRRALTKGHFEILDFLAKNGGTLKM